MLLPVSLETALRALAGLFFLYLLWRLGRALRRGRARDRRAVHDRAAEPRLFWAAIGFDAGVAVLLALILVLPDRAAPYVLGPALLLLGSAQYLLTRQWRRPDPGSSPGRSDFWPLLLIYAVLAAAALALIYWTVRPF
jgi:hypothetical protein